MTDFRDVSETIDDNVKRYMHMGTCDYIFYHVDLVTIFDLHLKIQKKAEYIDICTWCDENFNNMYRSVLMELNVADQGGIKYEMYFAFESEESAVAFKLRWV